jgi:hypothetical protein
VQGVWFNARKTDQHQGIASIVVREVVRLGRILHEPFAFLKPGSDNEGFWFRRWMRRNASHEDAVNSRYR